MLSWTRIVEGGALSAVAAAVLVALLHTPRRVGLIATAAVTGAAGPIAWNAILRAVHAPNFFTDAPISVFPVSWQDTGSGVFALAVASMAFGLGAMRGERGRRLVVASLLVGLAAFLVDIYLY